MHIFNKIFIVLIFSLISLSSCKKKEDVDNETQSVVDYALAEQQFASIISIVSIKALLSSSSVGFRVNTCGKGAWILVGNDTTTSRFQNDTLVNASGQFINGPVNFIIDYTQTSGCPDIDNVTKLGKVKIKSSHKWSAVSSQTLNTVCTATITFMNYSADEVNVNGVITLTRTVNATSNSIKSIVSNGSCAKDDWNIYYTSDKTFTQDPNGNFIVTGGSAGINKQGVNFISNITTAILKPNNFKFITSGIVEVTPDKLKTRTLDFGSGFVDDKASYTVNGQTIQFTMQ